MRRDAASVSIICFMVRASSMTGLNDASASTLTSGSCARAIWPSIHQPDAHGQDRQPAESHHGLHEAYLERLRLLEPDQMSGIVPALLGQLLIPVVPSPERRDLPHPLDAVYHVGVNVPHAAANLIAEPLDARVGEIRADGNCNEERRQHNGNGPRQHGQGHQQSARYQDCYDHRRDRVAEEVLDRLHVSPDDADKVARATPHHVRGREGLQFVVEVDPHPRQQPVCHVVRLPRLQVEENRRERREDAHEDQQRRHGLVAEYRSDQERAESAQDDDGAVMEHSQGEGYEELELDRSDQPEQPAARRSGSGC